MANTMISQSVSSPASKDSHQPQESRTPGEGHVTQDSSSSKPKAARSQGNNKRQQLNQIYTLPAPIRTFPLPTFYPNNPVSLLHVLYAWISQAVSPPPKEPSVVHLGTWSPETRSVHVTDQKSIRALWEQGFFGKGIYSRSEPNWPRREQSRKGQNAGHVAENLTAQRRRERNLMKWERARKEQDAIQKTRQQEAWVAPVGPLELLALPNSDRDLQNNTTTNTDRLDDDEIVDNAPVAQQLPHSGTNGAVPVPQIPVTAGFAADPKTASQQEPEPALKRQKSVRFSPKVESTTFQLEDPPSPIAGLLLNGKASEKPGMNGHSRPPTSIAKSETAITTTTAQVTEPENSTSSEDGIVDIEHLQLSPEEAFYLSFSLGVLSVIDPQTKKEIPPRELFTLLRQKSYTYLTSPSPSPTALEPDDLFMLHYAVYHHFRSLGWVVRAGIKFGVDWLLYHRGPVFSHAEFAVLVMPAYTHPWWKGAAGQQRRQQRAAPRKTWHWLHCANRVQAKALKTLVLVYVDIPPPHLCSSDDAQTAKGAAQDGDDVAALLGRYKIREFMVKRWLSNRNRD